MLKIAAVGDSHSLLFGGIKNFSIPKSVVHDTDCFWFGPVKIWGLQNRTRCESRKKFMDFFGSEIISEYDVIIVSVGEIDIRVNALPEFISDGMKYIEKLAFNIVSFLQSFDVRNIVIFGPPAAAEFRNTNTLCYPFLGSALTRNCLTHLLNLQLITQVESASSISFVTTFYDTVDTGLNSLAGHHLDGLHLNPDCQLLLARQRIAQAISGSRISLNENICSKVSEIDFHFCEHFSEPVNHIGLHTLHETGKTAEFFLKWAPTSVRLPYEKCITLAPLGHSEINITSLIHPIEVLRHYLSTVPIHAFLELATPLMSELDFPTGKSLISKLVSPKAIRELLETEFNNGLKNFI